MADQDGVSPIDMLDIYDIEWLLMLARSPQDTN
jgi:hypothetical protein